MWLLKPKGKSIAKLDDDGWHQTDCRAFEPSAAPSRLQTYFCIGTLLVDDDL
jgi:hypothetical protein